MYHKTHAALVHYHKCTRPWSCSPSISKANTLSQLLRLQYGYHKREKQWSCITRLVHRWFIMTIVQGHGHVARVSAMPVHYHNFLLVDYSMDITSVKNYGHVIQDSCGASSLSQVYKTMVMWPEIQESWSMIASVRSHGHVARDPHNAGTLSQVTALII